MLGQWSNVTWPLIKNLKMDRIEKADAIDTEGTRWVEYWKEMAGKTTHLYPHLLVAHLPNLVRSMPIDPYYLQLQSLEARHSNRVAMIVFHTESSAASGPCF